MLRQGLLRAPGKGEEQTSQIAAATTQPPRAAALCCSAGISNFSVWSIKPLGG